MDEEPAPPDDRAPTPGGFIPLGDATDRSDTPIPLRAVDPAIFQQWEPPPRQPPLTHPPSVFGPPFPHAQDPGGLSGASIKMEAGVMTGAPSVAQTRTTILGDKLVQNVEVPLTGVSASSLAGVPMVGLGSAPPNIHLEIPAQSSGYQFSASPDALIRTRYPDPDEAKARFAILAARVAVLEATLAAGSAGVGHNRGPSFDGKLDVDEKEIQEFIDRLKAQSATALVDLPKLMEAARVADPTINKWHERRDEFVKGVLKGVGTGMAIPIGKEIAEQLGLASKFSAVFSALQSVFEAFTAWLSLFLSLS